MGYPSLRKQDENWIMDSVYMDPNSGCWLWLLGLQNKFGHGRVRRRSDGKSMGAHRFSYEFFIGKIPEGMQVNHSCDVPSCCNPKHLFLGTQFDNMKDMAKKGRARNGHSYKTHCIRGHEFSGENLTVSKRGERICNICTKWRSKSGKNWNGQLNPS